MLSFFMKQDVNDKVDACVKILCMTHINSRLSCKKKYQNIIVLIYNIIKKFKLHAESFFQIYKILMKNVTHLILFS